MNLSSEKTKLKVTLLSTRDNDESSEVEEKEMEEEEDSDKFGIEVDNFDDVRHPLERLFKCQTSIYL